MANIFMDLKIPTKKSLQEAISCSIECLARNDGILFSAPIEENPPYGYDARKLHEVCINHKLAEYFAGVIIPLFDKAQKMFVDIEFNREGINFKEVTIDGEKRRVRPDIIVHNRKSGKAKFNFLVVECKKSDAYPQDIEEDCEKIAALMTNSRYDYNFGLQILYDALAIKGTLFYKQDGAIKMEPIEHNFAQMKSQ
jgi:hypothetical protein